MAITERKRTSIEYTEDRLNSMDSAENSLDRFVMMVFPTARVATIFSRVVILGDINPPEIMEVSFIC